MPFLGLAQMLKTSCWSVYYIFMDILQCCFPIINLLCVLRLSLFHKASSVVVNFIGTTRHFVRSPSEFTSHGKLKYRPPPPQGNFIGAIWIFIAWMRHSKQSWRLAPLQGSNFHYLCLLKWRNASAVGHSKHPILTPGPRKLRELPKLNCKVAWLSGQRHRV